MVTAHDLHLKAIWEYKLGTICSTGGTIGKYIDDQLAIINLKINILCQW